MFCFFALFVIIFAPLSHPDLSAWTKCVHRAQCTLPISEACVTQMLSV